MELEIWLELNALQNSFSFRILFKRGNESAELCGGLARCLGKMKQCNKTYTKVHYRDAEFSI